MCPEVTSVTDFLAEMCPSDSRRTKKPTAWNRGPENYLSVAFFNTAIPDYSFSGLAGVPGLMFECFFACAIIISTLSLPS